MNDDSAFPHSPGYPGGAPTEQLRKIPSAVDYCLKHNITTTAQWKRGWDACRAHAAGELVKDIMKEKEQ